MRQSLRSLLPSMFHRRLLLLGVTAAVVVGTLGVATARLTTGRSFHDARAASEAKLQTTRLIATRRGAILDRNGKVLAHDEPGWEVAVQFSVITGEWAGEQARAEAREDKLRWEALDDAGRAARVAELRAGYERQIEEMFRVLAEVSGERREQLRLRQDAIIGRVHGLQTYLWRRWQEQEERERGEPVPLEEVAKPIAAQVERHVIVSDLDARQRMMIETFIAEGRQDASSSAGGAAQQKVWREVELRRPTVRRYPMESVRVTLDRSTLPGPLASDEPVEVVVRGVATHIIGLIREAWQEDLEARPFTNRDGPPDLRGYRVGDRVGQSGVERSMEAVLRGARGLRRINADTDAVEEETLPVAGDDVVLSIDIMLQAHLQAIMTPDVGLMRTQPWHLKPEDDQGLIGNPLNGSAVVIDIASGDILAAVSMPAAPRSLLEDEPQLLWDDPINLPMLNRAIARPYQPGSTLKPLVLVAAISEGHLREGELVFCDGHLWPDNAHAYRDWIYKVQGTAFGEIDGVYAVARSSNVFFGIMAQRLMDQSGFDRMVQWYAAFGLGVKHDIGLAEEVRGALGPAGRELKRNEVEFMAIGQGPVSWTPLQAVTAYARLVGGDMSRRPRLVVSPEREREPQELDAAAEGLVPSATARRMALEGMRQGANTHLGTTHHITHAESGLDAEPIFNVDGVTIMAKSGTADPGSRWIDLDLDNEVDEGEVDREPRDHAWVVALVQPDGAARPTHAIAVVVEYAGSGGRVAGPVVNQIIHALQHHQYLQWPPVR